MVVFAKVGPLVYRETPPSGKPVEASMTLPVIELPLTEAPMSARLAAGARISAVEKTAAIKRAAGMREYLNKADSFQDGAYVPRAPHCAKAPRHALTVAALLERSAATL